MRVLLDMNLSPDLCPPLRAAGHDAVHWSALGAANASDETIMVHARDRNLTVLTHDLDFGAMLAMTHATGPSVVQVRVQDVLSDQFVALILATLRQFESELAAGALVIVDKNRARVRVLPMN
jgi:predicted nuclease of predicted toxin-antitoxin system